MRPVLGVQIEVLVDAASASEKVEWLRARVEAWVQSWYERHEVAVTADVPLAESVQLPAGHRITVAAESPAEEHSLYELTWQYPDDEDRSALWTSRVTIARDPTGVDLGLSLSIASVEFIVRPFRYSVFVPRVIREIVQAGSCALAGRPLSCAPRAVSVGDVGTFVTEQLTDPARRLPVVVVARVGGTDGLPVDPARLASDLCGLAEVWVLNDRWTAYALSAALGPRLSCFDGGIRTYWPGFTPADEPIGHPLITARRLGELEAAGNSIGRQMVRHLAPVTALRLADSARTVRVKDRIAELRRSEAREAVRLRIAQGDVDKLEEEWLKTVVERDELLLSVAEEKRRVEAAEQELVAVRANFALVSVAAVSPEFGTAVEEPAVLMLESVSDAVAQAQATHQGLNIWASAVKSASESRFARPEHVYRALEALAEIGEMYWRQLDTKATLGNLETLFQERGFKYAPCDGQRTVTDYGKERTFTEKKRKKLFERHLTLGGGDRQNCVQIYFDFDSQKKCVDVGYCGMHLPYDGMRS